MTVKLQSIASALPDSSWSNEVICMHTGSDPDFVKNKIGVENRFFLDDDESGVDLSERAVNNLFKKIDLSPTQVELLVVVTQTPDYKIPQNSALLQDRLGLDISCASFDISLGCSGYVYALSIVKGLMDVQELNNAVLVTCDPYSKIMDKRDKNTATIFGDAATASLLGREGGFEIGKADLGTDGQFSSSLKIDFGGAKNPIFGIHADSLVRVDEEVAKLNMKGREVFNFVVSNVPKSIENCLASNAVLIDDIEWFALHQGSKHMLDYMASKVPIPEQKMLRNLKEYGNTVSSTIPMLIENLLDKNCLIDNSKVLVSGFGVGLSWATNILTFKT